MVGGEGRGGICIIAQGLLILTTDKLSENRPL